MPYQFMDVQGDLDFALKPGHECIVLVTLTSVDVTRQALLLQFHFLGPGGQTVI